MRAIFLLLAVLSACSTRNREMQAQVSAAVEKSDYKKQLSIAENPQFYPEPRNRLLRLMELGTAQYNNGNWCEALGHFGEARGLATQQQTASIAGRIAAVAGPLDSDVFYGENFERSMIRFYEGMSHHNAFASGQGCGGRAASFHFQASQNVMREWSRFSDIITQQTAGRPTYKNNLMENLLGAALRERGSTSDRELSRNLYDQALVRMRQNYNIYPAYNSKSEDFRKEFSRLPGMTARAVDDLISPTPYAYGLRAYIDRARTQPDGVTVIVREGAIVTKGVKRFDFPVPPVILVGDMRMFALLVLSGDPPVLWFEMPTVNARPVTSQLSVEIGGAQTDLALALPLGDIAYREITDNLAAERAKIAAALIARHVAAIASAYAIYASQDRSPLALLASVASYRAAAAAINSSARPDVRGWASLPRNIWIGRIDAPDGEFDAVIKNGQTVVAKRKVSVSSAARIVDFGVPGS